MQSDFWRIFNDGINEINKIRMNWLKRWRVSRRWMEISHSVVKSKKEHIIQLKLQNETIFDLTCGQFRCKSDLDFKQ